MDKILHYESKITDHFLDTIQLAKEKSEINEAGIEARKHIIPMCNAVNENGRAPMTLYNQDQMLVMFQLGAAWRTSMLDIEKHTSHSGCVLRWKDVLF